MAISLTVARKLARVDEWQLVESSFLPTLDELTPRRLKQVIARARRLHDKYRDLAQQQRGEAIGKRTATRAHASGGNEHTLQKQELFHEAAVRFEQRLALLEPSLNGAAAESMHPEEPRTSARPIEGRRVEVQQAKATASAQRAESSKSLGARKAMTLAATGAAAHQAHEAARGRH